MELEAFVSKGEESPPALSCHVCHPGAPVRDLASMDNLDDEQLGMKEKLWAMDPSSQELWLFKYVRVSKAGQPESITRGEDWAELLVHAIAKELSIPSACVALGTHGERNGIFSRKITNENQELVHGNELLAKVILGYDKTASRGNSAYTVKNIHRALSDVRALDFLGNGVNAFDQFAAYLMLDALVAGRDRHHENWAIIQETGVENLLAPSFDHGNALGFAEQPKRILQLVQDEDAFSRWVAKGRSSHFSGKPSLVQLALEAYDLSTKSGREGITERLEKFSAGSVSHIVESIPYERMGEEQRKFVMKILERNRRGLLDGIISKK